MGGGGWWPGVAPPLPRLVSVLFWLTRGVFSPSCNNITAAVYASRWPHKSQLNTVTGWLRRNYSWWTSPISFLNLVLYKSTRHSPALGAPCLPPRPRRNTTQERRQGIFEKKTAPQSSRSLSWGHLLSAHLPSVAHWLAYKGIVVLNSVNTNERLVVTAQSRVLLNTWPVVKQRTSLQAYIVLQSITTGNLKGCLTSDSETKDSTSKEILGM